MAETGHVEQLTYQGREITIVGTAHISRRSVDEVERVIERVIPDTVCVELDQTRYDTLIDESRWRKLDIFDVIRQKKVLFLLVSIALAAYQRKLGERLGVKPGSELIAAVRKAKEVGAELVLADRDIQATLKRTWRNLSFYSKLKLASSLLLAPFAIDEISEEQIEELKDRDTISEMMNEFARIMPQVKTPLIDERDRYLMSSIQQAPGQKVVGVVGAGHVEGMISHLGESVDRKQLSEIPPPSRLSAALKWVIPALVLAAFYHGYLEHAGEGLRQMVFAWILPNSIAAALLSIVAGAKPMTVLVALVASPLTSLNPTIGAGMVAGLVEAWLRRPTVADCEHINDDITSLRGIYRNRFTRVLLVVVMATIGSAVGAAIGTTWVVTLL
jgi:pheromone shutdown-related protein TraB